MAGSIKSIIVFCLMSLVSISTYAQTKVVVIPMGGDDIMPEPFNPVTKQSPPDDDYTINENGTLNDSDDDTVIDKITGLEWQRVDDNTYRNSDEAFQYCADLDSIVGKSDWRLPLVSELQTIVDYDVFSPSINATVFPGTSPSYYWSASGYAGYFSNAWYVDFQNGGVSLSGETGSYYVRCVR